MATKPEESQIDKDLVSLYKSAKGSKTECPHCKELIEMGGDFAEKKAVMALRIEWEKVKRSKGGTPAASFFDDEKES